jgi:hypothetical protein
VISFHAVVRVLLKDMSRGRRELVDHKGVDRRPIGGDLDRRRAAGQRAGEERPCSRAVAAFADQDVDDLTVLVDRPVQVGPAARDLDLRFIDEPPITRRVACRTRGVDELRREGLHPPIHPHVINLDAALGQQLLHVAVRQPVAQISAHCHRDHLSREAVAGRSRRARPRIDHPISLPTRGAAQPTQQTPHEQDATGQGALFTPGTVGRSRPATILSAFASSYSAGNRPKFRRTQAGCLPDRSRGHRRR